MSEFGIGTTDPFTDFASSGGDTFEDWYNTGGSGGGIPGDLGGIDYGGVLENVLTAGLYDLLDIDRPYQQPVYDKYGYPVAYPVNASYPGTTTAPKTNWTPLIVGAIVVLGLAFLVKKVF